MRGINASGSGKQPAQTETPEQLLDVFKAAALSVTKLYKTSALAQSKARSNGYQDCLDDLLAFLDREDIGLSDGEGWRIRRWATERLDGRESNAQNFDSEDEVEKNDTAPTPELPRTSGSPQIATQVRNESPLSTAASIAEEPTPFIVPTQEHFNFQSTHPYPNIGNLALSDSRPLDGSSITTSRPSKARHNNSSRSGARPTTLPGQRAGSKRKLNFDEIFDIDSLCGKDPFGNGSKRSRYT